MSYFTVQKDLEPTGGMIYQKHKTKEHHLDVHEPPRFHVVSVLFNQRSCGFRTDVDFKSWNGKKTVESVQDGVNQKQNWKISFLDDSQCSIFTFSSGFHSWSSVHCVTEQTVPWHFYPDDSSHTRSCSKIDLMFFFWWIRYKENEVWVFLQEMFFRQS